MHTCAKGGANCSIFFSKLQQSNYYKISNTTYTSILYKKAYIYLYLCVLYITCVHVLIKLIVPKNYKIRGSKGERNITFFVRSVLMTEDFPTLGYPTNPTDIACLSLFNRANCLNTDRREP